MAVRLNKYYFIRLRGRQEGQECASIGHLEILSISSKRGTRGTREAEQEHMRGATEGQKIYNRGTKEALHQTENT